MTEATITPALPGMDDPALSTGAPDADGLAAERQEWETVRRQLERAGHDDLWHYYVDGMAEVEIDDRFLEITIRLTLDMDGAEDDEDDPGLLVDDLAGDFEAA